MIKFRNLVLLTALIVAAGCATIPTWSLVTAGITSIDTLQVQADYGWNRAPPMPHLGRRDNSQTWTRDGMLLDELVFIPAVPDGESLLVSDDEGAALPVFRKDMLPNEIEELAEATFVKQWGEGNAVLGTSNLRPQRFGEHSGIMFDFEANVTDSPDYRGIVGAFVVDDALFIMYYRAAHPYYFDKHRAAAEAVIMSAIHVPPTVVAGQ